MCKSIYLHNQKILFMFFASLRSSLQNLIPIVETLSIAISRVGNGVIYNYTRL